MVALVAGGTGGIGRAICLALFPLVETMLASSDALEGKGAFAEQRPPVWSGR